MCTLSFAGIKDVTFSCFCKNILSWKLKLSAIPYMATKCKNVFVWL